MSGNITYTTNITYFIAGVVATVIVASFLLFPISRSAVATVALPLLRSLEDGSRLQSYEEEPSLLSH